MGKVQRDGRHGRKDAISSYRSDDNNDIFL